MTFTATPYATVHDKELWFEQFKRFVKAGFPREKFTGRIYKGLSLHMFGHIAEYNIHGFYEVWFRDQLKRAEWVHYVLAGGAFGFKPLSRDDLWGDVERAVVSWLGESGFATAILKAAGEQIMREDLARLAALRAKYPDA